MAKDILLILLIIFLIGIVYQIFFNNPAPGTKLVNIKGTDFKLEVAATIPQKTKGLMGRTTLSPNGGMIFISDFDMPQVFWMKNTLIPLDMIFVNSTGKVINIVTAVPQPDTPDTKLTLYKSDAPAKYVIELNAGAAKIINLLPDDIIKL